MGKNRNHIECSSGTHETGTMLSVAVVHIVPEAEHTFKTLTPYPLPGALMLSGIFLAYCLEGVYMRVCARGCGCGGCEDVSYVLWCQDVSSVLRCLVCEDVWSV